MKYMYLHDLNMNIFLIMDISSYVMMSRYWRIVVSDTHRTCQIDSIHAFMFTAMSTDHRRKKESIVSTLMAISHLPSGKNQIELMIWATQNYKYMSLSNTYMSYREWA